MRIAILWISFFCLFSIQCRKSTGPRLRPNLILSLNIEDTEIFDNSRRSPITYHYPTKKIYNQLPLRPAISGDSIYIPDYTKTKILVYLREESRPQAKWQIPAALKAMGPEIFDRLDENLDATKRSSAREIFSALARDSQRLRIGLLAVDSRAQYIYVQIFFPAQKGSSKYATNPDSRKSALLVGREWANANNERQKFPGKPSFLVQLNARGEVITWIVPRKPFEQIIDMKVNGQNLVAVLHREYNKPEKMILSAYKDGHWQGDYQTVPIASLNIKPKSDLTPRLETLFPLLNKNWLTEPPPSPAVESVASTRENVGTPGLGLANKNQTGTEMKLDYENLLVPPSAEREAENAQRKSKLMPQILGVISLRNKRDFSLKERLIYRQSMPGADAKVLIRSNDFFTCARPDGSFILQEASESANAIVYKFYDANGKYLYRSVVRLESHRSSWRNLLTSSVGELFMTRFSDNQFEIHAFE